MRLALLRRMGCILHGDAAGVLRLFSLHKNPLGRLQNRPQETTPQSWLPCTLHSESRSQARPSGARGWDVPQPCRRHMLKTHRVTLEMSRLLGNSALVGGFPSGSLHQDQAGLQPARCLAQSIKLISLCMKQRTFSQAVFQLRRCYWGFCPMSTPDLVHQLLCTDRPHPFLHSASLPVLHDPRAEKHKPVAHYPVETSGHETHRVRLQLASFR